MDAKQLSAVVVGLGSMGKRRVRCLQSLGVTEIYGFDPREDRRKETAEKYSVKTFDSFKQLNESVHPDVMIISTPPDLHMEYAFAALEKKVSTFIEASVVDKERILELSNLAKERDVIFAPSCTMRYFEGPKIIKNLIRSGKIGEVLYFNYQTGQYLPDWHPWESIQEFYVSKRETGAAREIVPFEMTWLNDIFGQPEPLTCVKRKLSDMDADIDDIYICNLAYGSTIGNLTVEVLARPEALREMVVVGSKGLIMWGSDNGGAVRFKNTDMSDWETHSLSSGTVEQNYINPEEPYVEEINSFLKAHFRAEDFPNTLIDDVKILKTLEELERLAR